MQRKTKLVWILFIICSTFTTVIVLTRIPTKKNVPFVSTNNFLKYFESKYNVYKNRNNIQIVVLSENNVNKLKREMKKRIRHLNQVCIEIEKKTNVPESFLSKIVLDKKHNLSWCPIYKAASSTWMKYFADLSGVLTDTTMQLVRENFIQLSNIVKQVFSKHAHNNETIKAIAETTKFIIVRHPFERLLSAYRDKLEYIEGREYYYKRFGRHIVSKYRQNETIKNRTTLVPSFFEFLQFIVTERYFDEHWVPYYESCEPCLINYNYILKFENLKQEQLFLFKETSLYEYLDSYNELRNINPHGSTSTIIERYFKQIPKQLLQKVYEIYKNDFLLYSYFPDNYYLMSKDEYN